MRSRVALVGAGLAAACGGGGGSGGGNSAADARPADARPSIDGAAPTLDATVQLLTLTTFIGLEQAPLPWVAVQDGDGPWMLVTSADGVYPLDLASDRYGIAHVCDVDDAQHLFFFHATIAELPAVSRQCPGSPPALGTLSVQVTGLDDDGRAFVGIGIQELVATRANDTVAAELPAGDWDVIVTVEPNSRAITRVAIRSASVAAGQTTSIQLGAIADTVPVENHLVTVSGVDPAGVPPLARFLTAGGSMSGPLAQPSGASYASVPSSLLGAGDLHAVFANDFEGSGLRSGDGYLHAGADVVVELPASFTPQLAIEATEPVLRLAATFDPWPGADVSSLDARQGQPAPFSHRVRWVASAAYLAGGDQSGWSQPDLSGVDGWSDGWALDPRDTIVWTMAAVHATRQGLALEYADPVWRPGRAVTGDWDGASFTGGSVLAELVP